MNKQTWIDFKRGFQSKIPTVRELGEIAGCAVITIIGGLLVTVGMMGALWLMAKVLLGK
jgi:hypothetical protein